MRRILVMVFVSLPALTGCEQKKPTQEAPSTTTLAPTPPASTPSPVESPRPVGQQAWVTVKGRVVWNTAIGAAPKRKPITATKDLEVAAKDKDFNTEDWIVSEKNGGIKNVVVWLLPEPTEAELTDFTSRKLKSLPSFKATDIHPTLEKPAKKTVEIDQPCCRFIPHVLVAREGQEMIIKNSAPVPHNAKWTSENNEEINPLIPAGGAYQLKNPLKAERYPIRVECNIHPWMSAYIRVFDHPYFAMTDEDGSFEIKNAPVLKGKLRIFIWQENGLHGGNDGRFGKMIEVKPGTLDLKEIKFDTGK
jgi:hypothetical protein